MFSDDSIHGLCSGMVPKTFEDFFRQLLLDWRLRDLYRERAYDALEFQYTYWPEPDNITARSQEFINVSFQQLVILIRLNCSGSNQLINRGC